MYKGWLAIVQACKLFYVEHAEIQDTCYEWKEWCKKAAKPNERLAVDEIETMLTQLKLLVTNEFGNFTIKMATYQGAREVDEECHETMR